MILSNALSLPHNDIDRTSPWTSAAIGAFVIASPGRETVHINGDALDTFYISNTAGLILPIGLAGLVMVAAPDNDRRFSGYKSNNLIRAGENTLFSGRSIFYSGIFPFEQSGDVSVYFLKKY